MSRIYNKHCPICGKSIPNFLQICPNPNCQALRKIPFQSNVPKIEKNLPMSFDSFYDKTVKECKQLYQKKNKDYGDSWKDMRAIGITDVIHNKVKRIKQIEDNQGHSEISEGIESELKDIINYCIMRLWKEQNND